MEKMYEVRVDITVTKTLYTSAESEEEAERIIKEKLDKDPYYDAKTMDAVLGYEIIEVDECKDEEEDPLAKYSETYRDGIRYMLSQLDEDDKAIIRAECNQALNQHLIPDSNIVDDSKITDLLEEYGDDNDLPEGWYLEEYDASEVLMMI